MPDPFDDCVREAVVRNICPEDFAAEVLTRLDGGELSLLAMAYLLLETPAGGGWNTLREALVNDLASQPNDAAQVFNVAVSALRWPPLVMGEPRREGPPHLPTFTGSVRITPPGAKSPIEASANGPSVKLAQHRSAVVLLAVLGEVPPPTFDRIQPRVMSPNASAKARPLPADSDPITWLNTHAGRFHMKQPRFTCAELVNGQHHVVVRYNGLEAEGHAAVKQAAKREACAKLKALILADDASGAELGLRPS
jgi:hypothetical protein